ncbi:MAG: hypothetical protein Q8O85_10925 [Rhodoferax sp.]|uniref:hypothetical protein n=1 Tax=Rhodoferax sp. TaxID=50421 RepID=UPI0027324441|nr:hypothetical protein [Rhodoferax sp.]MDP2679218.1 hypothetical protein [Rhodoferax sp.]
MTSSKFTLATVAILLALGTSAYAKGPMNGQAAGAGAGTHTRSGNPEAGNATRTQSQAQSQARTDAQIRTRLQDMDAARVPGTGAAAGTPRGIHTPGTGLTTPTTTDSSVVNVQ